ncbi:MAG: DUF4381 family protein [Geminicoccaceae bacterium]
MNIEELLEGLRDIHLPAEAEATLSVGPALWPFAVFFLLVLAIFLVRRRRRHDWWHEAMRELTSVRDGNANLEHLVRLRHQVRARKGDPGPGLPAEAFQPAEPALVGRHLVADIERRLGAGP